jgi:hypothetical protein
LRAYASPASLPRPSPGSLPARAGSPLAGRVSHPLDDKSKFQGDIAVPPIPIDQQSLVALFFLCAAKLNSDHIGRRILHGVTAQSETDSSCGFGLPSAVDRKDSKPEKINEAGADRY